MRKACFALCLVILLGLSTTTFAAEKVDNVYQIGTNVGFYAPMGWLGENFDAGPGFGLFFGYGITEYFSMEIDYIPMIMTAPSGDDVDNMDTAVWGGFSNGGFGGIGIMGRLYPRKAFREADFKVVQPYLGLGFTYTSFIWENKSTQQPLLDDNGEQVNDANGNPVIQQLDDYDGVNTLLLDFAFGIDFYITEWVSLGFNVGVHKPNIIGDTLQGNTVDTDFESDFNGSMLLNGSASLKFQW